MSRSSFPDCDPPCDISDPFADSNTSTYIVACLVELRVSARTEEEAIRVAAYEITDVEIDGVVNLSFRIEDQPGRCCR